MKSLKIVSRKEGFRRAGFAFGAAPVSIDASALSEEQIAALKTDPMLIVVEQDVVTPDQDSAEGAAEPKPKKGGRKPDAE